MRDTRDTLLHSLASVVSGTVSDQQELTGTYDGHAITATLRRTGRIDNATIESGSDVNNFEVIELELRGAPGRSPWGFYTTLPPRIRGKWLSTDRLALPGSKLLSRLTPTPIDPTIDDRLRDGGMLDALDRLEPAGGNAPYVFVTYVPDGAGAITERLHEFEARGGAVAERARREADAYRAREQGGHLRIEVERVNGSEPTPEHFREMLDAAVAIADLNARLNPENPTT
jgi:hypothetical protein